MVRWAINNYYAGHIRNLALIALSFNPANDPGEKLRGYLSNITGALDVRPRRALPERHFRRTRAEGFEYSLQSLSYVTQFLTGLDTRRRRRRPTRAARARRSPDLSRLPRATGRPPTSVARSGSTSTTTSRRSSRQAAGRSSPTRSETRTRPRQLAERERDRHRPREPLGRLADAGVVTYNRAVSKTANRFKRFWLGPHGERDGRRHADDDGLPPAGRSSSSGRSSRRSPGSPSRPPLRAAHSSARRLVLHAGPGLRGTGRPHRRSSRPRRPAAAGAGAAGATPEEEAATPPSPRARSSPLSSRRDDVAVRSRATARACAAPRRPTMNRRARSGRGRRRSRRRGTRGAPGNRPDDRNRGRPGRVRRGSPPPPFRGRRPRRRTA